MGSCLQRPTPTRTAPISPAPSQALPPPATRPPACRTRVRPKKVPAAMSLRPTRPQPAPFPPRGTLTLRALRWGGVLAIFVSAVIIYLLWPTGARLGWDPSTPRGSVGTTFYLTVLAVIAIFGWLLSSRQSRRPGRRLAASVALILIPGLVATAITAGTWWHDYQVTGFFQPTLTFIPCIPASITVALLANAILHYTQNYIPRDPNIKCDVTYWGRLHRPATSSQASSKKKRKPAPLSISTRQRSIYLCTAILPTLLLTGFAAAPTLLRPESHTTADPDSIETPSMPKSLNSDAAWNVEFVNVMDIVGGSGGPIVLSAEGITSLNPSNGTTRWSYRQHARQEGQADYQPGPKICCSKNGNKRHF